MLTCQEGWLSEHPAAAAAVCGLLTALPPPQPGIKHPQLHSLLHEQVVWHDTLLPFQPLQGIAQVEALQHWLAAAAPDLQFTPTELISAEAHHVLLYYSAAGSHTGVLRRRLMAVTGVSSQEQQVLQDIPATGKSVQWTGSLVVRLQQAHAVSPTSPAQGSATAAAEAQAIAKAAPAGWCITAVWHSWDPLFIYEQIGLAPASLPPAPAAAPAQKTAPGAAAASRHQQQERQQEGQQQEQTGSPAGNAPGCEECKAAVQQYFEVYNSGDFSRLPSIVDPAYTYWGLIDLGGQQGVPGMQAMMAGWRSALSDFNISNDWLVCADGDRVIFRWVLQGRHTKGSLRGVPADTASPRLIRSCGVTALSIRRSRDLEQQQHQQQQQPCKIWRKVSHANGAELLRQLGVFDFGVTLE